MTNSGFYKNNSIKSITYNSQTGKGIDTGKLVRTHTTFRPKEESFGNMQMRELLTYSAKEKRTEITK
jgi:hypothetical protein